MASFSLTSIFILGLVIQSTFGQLTRTYQNCALISPTYDFKLYWTINGANIQVGMQATTPNGYMSIGMSRVASTMDSGEQGADAWAISNGVVRDIWMPDEDQPIVDAAQSLTNARTSRNTTHLFAEFDRALNTGDNRDYIISTTNPIYVISAIHQTRAIGAEIPEHRWWGNTQINFGGRYSCNTVSSGNSFTSGDGKFRVRWALWETDKINITMDADYTGWISLGLNSASPRMTNADCYTGWVNGATTVLLDTWSPDSVNQPREDTSLGGQSNVMYVRGSESGGKTTISFTRLLNTGDTAHDVAIGASDLYIILGWANADGTGTGAGANYPKHVAYTSGRVNFLSNSTATGGGGGTGIGGEDPIGASFNEGDFSATWQIVDQTIIVKMSAKATGYISFGFADNPTMTNADYVVGWVSGTNTHLYDTWSTGESLPTEDTLMGGNSDLTLIRGEETDGVTTIVFSRPLDTGDTSADEAIINGDMYLQYAFHKTNDGLDGTFFVDKHTNYGSAKVNFFSGATSGVFDITPGFALSISVAGIALFYLVFRYTNKAIKNCRGKKKHSKKEKSISKIEASEDNPNVYQKHMNNNKGTYGVGGYNDSGHTMPTGRTYYRGSQKLTAPVDFSSYGYDEQDLKTGLDRSASQFSVAEPEIAPKKSGSRIGNFCHGVINVRLPAADYSLASLLIGFFYLILNIACLFVMMNDIPQGLGTLIGANFLLVTIPATRNSLLVYLFHVPFDKAIMYHRWMGRWIVGITFWHFFWYLVRWILNGSVKTEIASKNNIFGLVGAFCALFIFATSIEWIRRRRFEVFFYSHFAFLGFAVFGCLHSKAFIPYAIAAAVLYVLDRIIRLFWGMVPMKTLKLNLKDSKNGVVQVVFKKHMFAKLFKVYKVGQYAFLNFPGINLLEWHPFSISSGPDETTMEVHIKGLGDHTQKLIEKAKTKSQLWMRVDGPYGNQKINHRRFPVVFLCAGGIGVTPIMSILKDIYRYGELDPKAKKHRSVIEKVYVCYTIQTTEMYNWFSDEWQWIYDKAAQGGPGVPQLILNIYVTKAGDDLDTSFFIKGRPSFPEIFETLVNDNPGKPSMVFVCGPKQIVNQTWDLAMKKNRSGHKIHFHHETFEF